MELQVTLYNIYCDGCVSYRRHAHPVSNCLWSLCTGMSLCCSSRMAICVYLSRARRRRMSSCVSAPRGVSHWCDSVSCSLHPACTVHPAWHYTTLHECSVCLWLLLTMTVWPHPTYHHTCGLCEFSSVQFSGNDIDTPLFADYFNNTLTHHTHPSIHPTSPIQFLVLLLSSHVLSCCSDRPHRADLRVTEPTREGLWGISAGSW